MRRYEVARPWLGSEEVAFAVQAINSGWVTQGPMVKKFEADFAKFVGASHAIAVSSCTTALHLSLLAVGVRPGDIVVTVSHSFIATANAIRHAGAEPYFIDIDPLTHNMDPARLEEFLQQNCTRREGQLYLSGICLERFAHHSAIFHRLKPECVGRVAAVLVVHQTGIPAAISEISGICEAHGLQVLEDAACAVGSMYGSRHIGKPFGSAVCFSFHPRKLLTTGDGGMITTDDDQLAAHLRRLRQHGMTINDLERHNSSVPVFEQYDETGYNYRLTDVQAGLGLAQLAKLSDQIEIRSKLASVYIEELNGFSGLKVLESATSDHKQNWQSLVLTFSKTLNQIELLTKLKAKGVESRRGVMCSHLEKPYSELWSRGSLPESERASEQSLILPLYVGLEVEDLKDICRNVKEVITSV